MTAFPFGNRNALRPLTMFILILKYIGIVFLSLQSCYVSHQYIITHIQFSPDSFIHLVCEINLVYFQ